MYHKEDFSWKARCSFFTTVHPSIYPLAITTYPMQGRGGNGAYPSWHMGEIFTTNTGDISGAVKNLAGQIFKTLMMAKSSYQIKHKALFGVNWPRRNLCKSSLWLRPGQAWETLQPLQGLDKLRDITDSISWHQVRRYSSSQSKSPTTGHPGGAICCVCVCLCVCMSGWQKVVGQPQPSIDLHQMISVGCKLLFCIYVHQLLL